jgi:hypothetical protein
MPAPRRRTIDMALDDDLDMRLFSRRPSAASAFDAFSDDDEEDENNRLSGVAESPNGASLLVTRLTKQHRAEGAEGRKSRAAAKPASNKFVLFESPAGSSEALRAPATMDDSSQDDGFGAAFGGSRLVQLRQEQDSEVEGLFFIATAAAKRPAPAALIKVIDALSERPQLIAWVRRGNRTTALIDVIAGIRAPSSPAAQLLVVECLRRILDQVGPAALGRLPVLTALARIVHPAAASQSDKAADVAKPKRRHWAAVAAPAAQATPTVASPLSPTQEAALSSDAWDEVASVLTTPEADEGSFATHGKDGARSAFLAENAAAVAAKQAAVLARDIVVSCEQSPEAAAHRETVTKAVAQSGLWQAAAASLQDASEEVAAATIHAVEASTCHTTARSSLRNVIEPRELFDAVSRTFVAQSKSTNASPHLRQLVVKLFMNLTTAFPGGIAALNRFAPDVCNAAAAHVTSFAAVDETDGVTLVACLLLNLLTVRPEEDARLELPDGDAGRTQYVNHVWRSAVCASRPLLQGASAQLVAMHGALGDVARNVCGGYLALLLAACSLGDEAARVAVLTALAPTLPKASAEQDRKLAERPMRFVAAVVQEFVLFQSDAGILTCEALVSMHRISEQLLRENPSTAADE